ncbi:hypothetical protein Lesp02_23070 [Lentzea sp. NBRC 105346]|uniref:hypothetical protein n=1 Tax=Lentzea sp. NBRC 105346 TaxID=3032205 RepID=UPI0024A320F4|nr:hypothetical protein [Lentzea sp. NBRC 105346]GLZ30117.1 hypothetical protein Lesp02_23070 [Lentzea sp. NBRC 105346]
MGGPQFWEALRQHPCLAELAELARPGRGWVFLPAFCNGVECLFGVHVGEFVSETIIVRSEEDVTVARLRNDDFLEPRRSGMPQVVLWEYTGTLVDALQELRELPGHDHPAAPKLLRPASSMFVIADK